MPEKGDDHHGAQGDGGGVVAGGVLPGGKGEVSRRRQRRRRVAWRALTLSFYSSRFVAKLASAATASRCFCLTAAAAATSLVHEVGSTRPSH